MDTAGGDLTCLVLTCRPSVLFLLMLFLLFGGFLLSESHIPWSAA